MSPERYGTLSVIGVGAAACVACCAGPILAVFGGVGLAGLASTFFLGAAGFVIAAAAFVALIVIRRRRSACPTPDDSPIPVAAPTRRRAETSRSVQ